MYADMKNKEMDAKITAGFEAQEAKMAACIESMLGQLQTIIGQAGSQGDGPPAKRAKFNEGGQPPSGPSSSSSL